MSKQKALKTKLLKINNNVVRELIYRTILKVYFSITNLKNKYLTIKHRMINKNNHNRRIKNIYQNMNILDDEFVKIILDNDSLTKQEKFIDNQYLLHLTFVDFHVKSGDYDQLVEFGTFNGKLAYYLAIRNPSVHIHAYDIVPGTQELNNVYERSNITFYEKDLINENFSLNIRDKTLFISKGSLCCLDQFSVQELFKKLSENNIDIILMEPCSYILNNKSLLMSISNKKNGHVLYSHPYNKILLQFGYKVLYNSQDYQLSYLYQRYNPYYLTFIYATV